MQQQLKFQIDEQVRVENNVAQDHIGETGKVIRYKRNLFGKLLVVVKLDSQGTGRTLSFYEHELSRQPAN